MVAAASSTDAGDDEAHVRGDAQQGHAVEDRADDEGAEQRRPRRAAAAEQAGAADHGAGDGVEEHVVAARRLAHRQAAAGGEHAAHGGQRRGQHEHQQPDPLDLDAGPAGRLDVAADGVDVAAEAGAAQERVDDDHDARRRCTPPAAGRGRTRTRAPRRARTPR